MNITCIPLDKRPYNYQFLKDISAIDKDIHLILPKIEELGEKKNPANLDYIKEFLFENTPKSEALILSLDMLVYGGLFPARIHNIDEETLKSRVDILKEIKKLNPELKIYISSLILRTPKYNSNEEEPFYYGEFGKDIFLWGHYTDKLERNGELDTEEEKDFSRIKKSLPKEYLSDFVERRKKNRKVTEYCLELCKEGIIEMVIIPQDDASEYGHTALDQRYLYHYISINRLQNKVFLHPGTDEAGCTLLTRAYTDKKGKINIYPLYSCEEFKKLIPNYEDRTFENSFLSHTLACGINIVENIEEADVCIGISGAPGIMQEAFEVSYGIDINGNVKITQPQLRKNILYYRNRNLSNFISKMESILNKNIEVGVLDVAFSNGGERELLELLDEYRVLEKISAYSGWNTTCNSLGTVLATLTFAHFGKNREGIEYFKIARLINDWAYQTETRFDVQLNDLKKFGATYSNFNSKEKKILEIIKIKTEKNLKSLFQRSYQNNNIEILEVKAPFGRLSGLEFKFKIQ